MIEILTKIATEKKYRIKVFYGFLIAMEFFLFGVFVFTLHYNVFVSLIISVVYIWFLYNTMIYINAVLYTKKLLLPFKNCVDVSKSYDINLKFNYQWDSVSEKAILIQNTESLLQWCNENCTGKWLWMRLKLREENFIGKLLFQKKSDAALFKLFYSDEIGYD
jgi:hypothetical protein